jgi:hypothetical protein
MIFSLTHLGQPSPDGKRRLATAPGKSAFTGIFLADVRTNSIENTAEIVNFNTVAPDTRLSPGCA